MTLTIELTERMYQNIRDIKYSNFKGIPYKGIIMSAIKAIQNGRVCEEQDEQLKNMTFIKIKKLSAEDMESIYKLIKEEMCNYYEGKGQE